MYIQTELLLTAYKLFLEWLRTSVIVENNAYLRLTYIGWER